MIAKLAVFLLCQPPEMKLDLALLEIEVVALSEHRLHQRLYRLQVFRKVVEYYQAELVEVKRNSELSTLALNRVKVLLHAVVSFRHWARLYSKCTDVFACCSGSFGHHCVNWCFLAVPISQGIAAASVHHPSEAEALHQRKPAPKAYRGAIALFLGPNLRFEGCLILAGYCSPPLPATLCSYDVRLGLLR